MNVTRESEPVHGSGLGFGCAELFRLPTARERRRVLDAAIAAGIVHFDVAPMYGLGLAEPELGAVARAHPGHVRIATKFGIELTQAGRGLGMVQGPVRRLLEKRPGMRATARASGGGPTSGRLGSLLYRSDGYTPQAARASLAHSLRALRRDRVDLLLLHDPTPDKVASDVADALQELQDEGLIGAWGIAGETSDTSTVEERLARPPGVIQVRESVFDRPDPRSVDAGRLLITFGTLGEAIGRIARHLEGQTGARQRWSDAVGRDLGDRQAMVDLLLRHARRTNPTGITLYSTTRPERLERAVVAAGATSADEEVDAFVALIATELAASVEVVGVTR